MRDTAYERGVRARQSARERAEKAKAFAESFLKPKKPKSPFEAIKKRMDTVKNRGVKQGIGAAAIRFRRKKKDRKGSDNISSASSTAETAENTAQPIADQPAAPGPQGELAPPAAPVAGPPPETDQVELLHNYPDDSHEFRLQG